MKSDRLWVAIVNGERVPFEAMVDADPRAPQTKYPVFTFEQASEFLTSLKQRGIDGWFNSIVDTFYVSFDGKEERPTGYIGFHLVNCTGQMSQERFYYVGVGRLKFELFPEEE